MRLSGFISTLAGVCNLSLEGIKLDLQSSENQILPSDLLVRCCQLLGGLLHFATCCFFPFYITACEALGVGRCSIALGLLRLFEGLIGFRLNCLKPLVQVRFFRSSASSSAVASDIAWMESTLI